MNHYDNNEFAGIMTNALVGLVIWAALLWAVHSFLSIPTVAKNIDGECEYIQYPDGQKRECGELPVKYHEIYVSPKRS